MVTAAGWPPDPAPVRASLQHLRRRRGRRRTDGACVAGTIRSRICHWYSKGRRRMPARKRGGASRAGFGIARRRLHATSASGLHSPSEAHFRETLRPRTKSPGNSSPARAEPGAILDADRRHAERRLAVRERSRDAQAGARAAAPRSRRADRPVAVKRVDFEIISYLKESHPDLYRSLRRAVRSKHARGAEQSTGACRWR